MMPRTPSQRMVGLLTQLVEGQEKQNRLLQSVADELAAERRGRAATLEAWKKANPLLAAGCREANETWGKVYNAALADLTKEVVNQSDGLIESNFTRQELIDRFGPRMQHLNALTIILQQLGGPLSPPAPAGETR